MRTTWMAMRAIWRTWRGAAHARHGNVRVLGHEGVSTVLSATDLMARLNARQRLVRIRCDSKWASWALVFAALSACAQRERMTNDPFGATIRGSDLPIEIVHPVKLALGTTLLAIGDAEDPSAPLRVFRRHDVAVLAAVTTSKANPSPFDWIASLQIRQEREGEMLWVFDARHGSMMRYVPRENTRLASDSTVTIAVRGVPLFTYWMDDTLLVTGGVFPDTARYYLWTTAHSPKAAGVVPYLTASLPAWALQQALQPAGAVRPSGRMVAIGSRFAGRLDLYRVPNDTPRLARTPRAFEPQLRIGLRGTQPNFLQDRATRAGYISVAATDSNVYALFSGLSAETATGSDRPGRVVDVFDWAGQLTQSFWLDRDALEIAVDPRGGEMVAVVEKNAKDQRNKRYWLRKYTIPSAPERASGSTNERGGP
jgi:hypothetical protein